MYAFFDRLSRRLLAALAFALTLAPTAHAGGRNNFTLDSDAPGIDRMQVIVRGPDLEEPLRYDFVAEAGEIAGGFAIPPGKLREIVLLGFAEGDREPVFRGTTLVTVDEGLNGPVTIPLTSIESDTSVVATIGTYRVWTIREELGKGEGLRFRAGLIDGDGMPVEVPPRELRWDIFDHPKNGVFPCATQEFLCVELRPPLRVNADVAACFKDVFCKASPPTNDPYVQVALGEFHSCARTQSGRVFCWGSNQRGQLGVSTPTNAACAGMPQTCSPFPVEVQCTAGTACRFISVSAGGTQTCAVDTNRRTWCWGWPATAARLQPSFVPEEIRAIDGNTGAPVPLVHVDVARTYGCALSSSNDAWCFGADQYWQPGSGLLFNPFASMVPGAAKYTSVVAGESHACGIHTGFTGAMDCWGYNYYEQLSSNLSKPTVDLVNMNDEHKSLVSNTGFATAAAGFTNTCAQTKSGNTVCWGSPEPTYQYGRESIVLPGSYTATSIATSKSASCLTPSGSFSYTCARVCVASGPLHCGAWVPGTHLQLVPNQPQYKVFQQVDMDGNHQCALTSQGEIWCWGNNEFGQLGDGTASSAGSSKLVQVTPIRNPVTLKTFSIAFP